MLRARGANGARCACASSVSAGSAGAGSFSAGRGFDQQPYLVADGCGKPARVGRTGLLRRPENNARQQILVARQCHLQGRRQPFLASRMAAQTRQYVPLRCG
jgi:hypothetical protein